MSLIQCPECGITLTQEMLNANMCWECGKILNESLLDKETLDEISRQKDEQDSFDMPKIEIHKLTTGYNFEGYHITNYIELVSGEIVIGAGFLSDFKAGVADFFGRESKAYSDKLKEAKKAALFEMIMESIRNGGNAVVGISYGYVTFSGNMIGISVNGTSVKIEPVLPEGSAMV